jgi:hypothetical protein
MVNGEFVFMDADAYENQFKPWLGQQRFRWADQHSKPGPPGIRLVPRKLAEAFVARVNQRAITDAEERALGLPGDAPDWDQREVYNRDPQP